MITSPITSNTTGSLTLITHYCILYSYIYYSNLYIYKNTVNVPYLVKSQHLAVYFFATSAFHPSILLPPAKVISVYNCYFGLRIILRPNFKFCKFHYQSATSITSSSPTPSLLHDADMEVFPQLPFPRHDVKLLNSNLFLFKNFSTPLCSTTLDLDIVCFLRPPS